MTSAPATQVCAGMRPVIAETGANGRYLCTSC